MSQHTQRGHLVVMAREPRMGRVKTRLAKDIGTVAAWRFYQTMLHTTTRTLRSSHWNNWLAVTPEQSEHRPNIWPRGWKRLSQRPGDLGARMLAPMQTLPPGPVVVVGTDAPGVTRQHIATAFKALGSADLVLGPAEDGGYWLIGQRRRPVLINPFINVRWSSEHALDDTVGAALHGPRRTRIALIDTLWDVDDKTDYERWKS